jgi:aspartyl-tRNA(Asn)/glutamyl-tRNA(Gln) amidotransferase subunit A
MIDKLQSEYRSRKISPVEIVRDLLGRIETSRINAYITVLAETAMREALQAQHELAEGISRGPLHGIPIAVKDLVNVAGVRTTMGSQQYAEFVPQEDAEIIRLLRQAGAIVIGKTNTHEFAYGPTGDRSYFGAVRNPRDVSRMTGGSSSGSAAAIAAGLAYGAIGTDTSASIRLPAALCGVVGMKPSIGLVPKGGVFPLSETLDHVGPLTSTVRDSAILLEGMAGKSAGYFSEKIGTSIRGKIVGLPDHFYCDYLSRDVRAALDEAANLLRDAGAVIKRVNIEGIEDIYAAQQLVLKSEAYTVHQKALESAAPYDEEVRQRLLTGSGVLASEYIRALQFKQIAVESFRQALSEADILLTATCGITAPLINDRITELNGEKQQTRWLLTRLTAPTNFSGNPSLAIPFGTDSNEMPIGLQLIGRINDESVVYQFGSVFENE